MATFTTTTDRFPAGTTVTVYPESNWPTAGLPPSGAPIGSSTTSAAVGSDSTLTFTGLTENTTYYMTASISGTYRYVKFRVTATNPDLQPYALGGSVAQSSLVIPNYQTAQREKLLLTGYGLAGQTFSRNLAGGAFAPSAGDQRATLAGFIAGDVVTSVYCHVTSAGSGVTLAKLCIWDNAGTLLASTADIDSEFNSGTGVKGGALSSAWTCPSSGAYYVGMVTVGGTSATILRGTSGITGYAAQAASGGVVASVANTGKTDAGALTLTGSGTAPWFGWA